MLPGYQDKQKGRNGAADAHGFSGKRVQRGLYRAANGRRINADVHGSYTIQRTGLPDAFVQGIAGTAVCLVRLPIRTKRVA
jgi:putative transposase